MPRLVIRLMTLHPIFCLGPLIRQGPGVKTPVDDRLVATHRHLDQAPTIVT
jgi:hypothetical protein